MRASGAPETAGAASAIHAPMPRIVRFGSRLYCRRLASHKQSKFCHDDGNRCTQPATPHHLQRLELGVAVNSKKLMLGCCPRKSAAVRASLSGIYRSSAPALSFASSLASLISFLTLAINLSDCKLEGFVDDDGVAPFRKRLDLLT